MATTTAPPPPPPPGLPPCLHASIFGADLPTPGTHPATRIACVGCRLRPHLAAVDAFVEQKCTSVPPGSLYRLAKDLYDVRVRPALASSGAGAPEWKHEAVLTLRLELWTCPTVLPCSLDPRSSPRAAQIQEHYERCSLSVRLTIVRKLREYRELRTLLLGQLQRAAEEGVEDPPTLALYAKVAAREVSQHAHLQTLPPPAPPPPPPPPPQHPSRRVAPPSLPAPASSAPHPLAHQDAAADDAASAAGTERAVARAYDEATARDALRGALFQHIEPCPAPLTTAQPTLREVSARTDAAEVLARCSRERLRDFQGPKPASGRRCFCRGDAPECHIVLDAARAPPSKPGNPTSTPLALC